MIAAICCRCRRELGEKGGILLSAPEREGALDGLFCDWVVKYHVCAACMEPLLGWLKVPSQPSTLRCNCGAELNRCVKCGAGEPVGTVVCPVAERKAGRKPVVEYHTCSLHYETMLGTADLAYDRGFRQGFGRTSSNPRRPTTQSGPTPSTPSPTTTHVLFEGHALCGFMAGGVPSGWPDGHNWVSIADVLVQEEPPEASRIPLRFSIPALKDDYEPCRRCLTLVPVSSLTRSRA